MGPAIRGSLGLLVSRARFLDQFVRTLRCVPGSAYPAATRRGHGKKKFSAPPGAATPARGRHHNLPPSPAPLPGRLPLSGGPEGPKAPRRAQ